MLRISEAIIVEGKYDKIKLSSVFDALIIEVNGFQIFKDKEKSELIKAMALSRGIIILTDSDSAGMQIRNRIKNIAPNGKIYNAYIPEVPGKERRKAHPSAQGLLGVEGVEKELIIEAVKNCGIEQFLPVQTDKRKIDTALLYSLGLTGSDNSSILRSKLLKRLNLPTNISKNNMLKIFEYYITAEELIKLTKELRED